MKIICAGLSKTGTKSMAVALRHLGYTVYDFLENQADLDIVNEYLEAEEEKRLPNFAAMYSNVDAVTDVPPARYSLEIFEVFPNAKVILMVRDSKEEWMKSLEGSLDVWNENYEKIWLRIGRAVTPTGRKWKRYIDLVMRLLANLDYYGHIDKLTATVPSDQLLIFNLKQGWKPLCNFLDHEVPKIPFPRRNVKGNFIPDLFQRNPIVYKVRRELVAMVTISVLLVAFLIVLMTSMH